MKRTLLLIGLGIAFLAVSLWVILSNGRSARAIRTKFRLGGAILTLTTLTSLASCDDKGPFVTCYDPYIPANNIELSQDYRGTKMSNGDAIVITGYLHTECKIVFTVSDTNDNTLQSEEITINETGDTNHEFILNAGDYKGEARFTISYNVYGDTEQLVPILAVDFVIE